MSDGREAELLRQRAYAAVARALKRGTLKRGPCAVCGAGNAHAHHGDYAKPLAVEWLCPRHHRRHHGSGLPDKLFAAEQAAARRSAQARKCRS